jgi:undecaprenyl-diphosphatase
VTDWLAALLGVIQGVFMFVPVSSTSHLAFTQHWLQGQGAGIPDPDSAEMILFDLVVHAGTVLSIIIVLRRRLFIGACELINDIILWRTPRELKALRIAILLAVSTAVTGVLGLGIRVFAGEVFGAPAAIAVMLIFTGGVLWWTDRARPSGVTQLTVGIAVGIGAAQALALLPGLSRSGLTIAAALALGLRRPAAAEYSFVLAIPTILLATVIQAVAVGFNGPIGLSFSAMAVGFVVAAAVGVVSLHAVLRLLYATRFRIFSGYVWGLAAVVLIFGISAPT